MTGLDTVRGRRGLALAAGTVAAGAGLVLLAGTRPLLVTVDGAGLGDGVPVVGGPLASAVGLVGLAAAGALLLTGCWSRRVVGALVLVGGLALLASGGPGPPSAGITEAPDAPTSAVWSWLFRTGAAGMGVGGALTLSFAGSWPRPGGRYRREPHGREPQEAAARGGHPADARPGPGRAPDRSTPDRSLWDALDRGEDPTA